MNTLYHSPIRESLEQDRQFWLLSGVVRNVKWEDSKPTQYKTGYTNQTTSETTSKSVQVSRQDGLSKQGLIFQSITNHTSRTDTEGKTWSQGSSETSGHSLTDILYMVRLSAILEVTTVDDRVYNLPLKIEEYHISLEKLLLEQTALANGHRVNIYGKFNPNNIFEPSGIYNRTTGATVFDLFREDNWLPSALPLSIPASLSRIRNIERAYLGNLDKRNWYKSSWLSFLDLARLDLIRVTAIQKHWETPELLGKGQLIHLAEDFLDALSTRKENFLHILTGDGSSVNIYSGMGPTKIVPPPELLPVLAPIQLSEESSNEAVPPLLAPPPQAAPVALPNKDSLSTWLMVTAAGMILVALGVQNFPLLGGGVASLSGLAIYSLVKSAHLSRFQSNNGESAEQTAVSDHTSHTAPQNNAPNTQSTIRSRLSEAASELFGLDETPPSTDDEAQVASIQATNSELHDLLFSTQTPVEEVEIDEELTEEVHAGIKSHGKALETALRGVYGSNDGDLLYQDSIDQEALRQTLEGLPHIGVVTGVPTNKADLGHTAHEPINRLLGSLLSSSGRTVGRWAFVVIANPIPTMKAASMYKAAIDELEAIRNYSDSILSERPTAEKYKQLVETYAQRIDHGKRRGLWHTTVYLLAEDESTFNTLQTSIRMFNGDQSLPDPIRVTKLDTLQESMGKFPRPLAPVPSVEGHIQYDFLLQTVLSSKELAAWVHLPTKEFPGFHLKLDADFDVQSPASLQGAATITIPG